MEALALELRARLTAHPGVVPLMIGGPMDGPHALALNERLLELLADAGLNPVDAARAAYLLIVYVFGSIALEVADLQPGPLPPESERIASRHRALAATPAHRYPRAAAQPPPSPATSPPSSTSGASTEYSTGLPRTRPPTRRLQPGAQRRTTRAPSSLIACDTVCDTNCRLTRISAQEVGRNLDGPGRGGKLG